MEENEYTESEYTPPESYFLASFDEQNRLEDFVLIDGDLTDDKYNELVADEYVKISETDWKYYQGYIDKGEYGNGYIRDPETNSPVSAPESSYEQINTVKKEYEEQVKELKDSLVTAILSNDEELVSELKEEYAALMQEYMNSLEEANNG